jgi:hypothetical protein
MVFGAKRTISERAYEKSAYEQSTQHGALPNQQISAKLQPLFSRKRPRVWAGHRIAVIGAIADQILRLGFACTTNHLPFHELLP